LANAPAKWPLFALFLDRCTKPPMTAIRSLLWIGPGEGLTRNRVADAPTLDVTWVQNPEEALALAPARFDAALLDAAEPDALLSGLRRLRRLPKFPPLLVRLPQSQAGRMRELLAAGAADVLLDPEDPDAPGLREEFLDRVERLAGGTTWARTKLAGDGTDAAGPAFAGILGTSRAMRAVFALVERATRSTATVLLTGETGTGKELIARAIHEGGPRRAHPFVAVNCAAFPDTLLESELFGHVKGSFTGADRDKPGLFEVAGGGSLFLDEIGETSGPLQAKLLRVLQEREIRPVGGTRSRRVDVRVVTATNRDLRSEAARGFFRDDLYYRLAVFPIAVPPLRERRDDILLLAAHFLERHGRREAKRGCRFSRAAEHLLLAYRWPGNVRELENEVQRVLALAEPGEVLTPALLSERLADVLEPVEAPARPGETLRESLARVEAWLIRRTLEHNGGRRAATARQLGVTREGLYKKMKRLGIP
jgi:transcriptional regulator with PAS, ATPase and Fis domain